MSKGTIELTSVRIDQSQIFPVAKKKCSHEVNGASLVLSQYIYSLCLIKMACRSGQASGLEWCVDGSHRLNERVLDRSYKSTIFLHSNMIIMHEIQGHVYQPYIMHRSYL